MAEATRIVEPQSIAKRPAGVALLRDGARVTVEDGALELHDASGRLLLRYADGHAEISAPDGDLTLAAPRGHVRVRSAGDVTIEADRDLVCGARRDVELSGGGSARLRVEPDAVHVAAPRLAVEAPDSRLITETARVVARSVSTHAERVVTQVEHYELEARRLVEKAHTAYRDVQDLYQQRLGRARAVVRDVFTLRSRRTDLVSERETSIDGERILLG